MPRWAQRQDERWSPCSGRVNSQGGTGQQYSPGHSEAMGGAGIHTGENTSCTNTHSTDTPWPSSPRGFTQTVNALKPPDSLIKRAVLFTAGNQMRLANRL